MRIRRASVALALFAYAVWGPRVAMGDLLSGMRTGSVRVELSPVRVCRAAQTTCVSVRADSDSTMWMQSHFAAYRVARERGSHAADTLRIGSASDLFSFGDYYSAGFGWAAAIADFNSDGKIDVAVTAEKIGIWTNDGSGHLSESDSVDCDREPAGIVAADLDGDGRMDLAVACVTFSGIIEIFKGHGDGTFDPPVDYAVGHYPIALAAGDLDGDGRPELVVAIAGDNSIAVLRNRGDGFDPPVSSDCGPVPFDVVIADLDHDGHPDVAAADFGCVSVSVFHNLGNGILDERLEYLTRQGGINLRAFDLDGDGAIDLELSGAGYVEEVLWGDGSGGFAIESVFPIEGNASGGIVVGDLDGDGRADLAFLGCAWERGWITVLLNRGSRTDWTRVSYGLKQRNCFEGHPNFIGLADLEGTGLPDVVTFSDDNLVVVRHVSRSLLAGLAEYDAGPDSRAAYALSLDGGRPAVLLLSGLGGYYDAPGPRRAWLMTPDGDGRLGPPVDYPEGAVAIVADLNGDGCADVMIPHGDSIEVHPCGGSRFMLPRPPGTARVVALADFDGDGSLDYLLGNSSDSLAIALDRPGHGVAAPESLRAPIPTGYSILVEPADLDGDGRADLAVLFVGVGENDIVDSLIVLRNDGQGGFTPRDSLALPPPFGYQHFSPPRQLLRVDIDGDGLVDLIPFRVESDELGDALVARNLGARGFDLLPQDYFVINENPTLCAFDFDGDGLPELTAFTPSDGTGNSRLQCRINRGAGQFEEPGFIRYLDGYVASLSIADLNGDQKPDLIFGSIGFRRDSGVLALMNKSPGVPSAIALSFLSAQVTSRNVRLAWFTSSAALLHATVCRHMAGAPWSDVGEVSGDGSGTLVFDDAGVAPGERYSYRLRYHEGTRTEYSAEADVLVPSLEFGMLALRPNPGDGRIAVSFSAPGRTPATLELIDVTGRRLRSCRLASPGPTVQSIVLVERGSLPAGIYWVRLTQSDRSATTRAVVIR